MSDKKRPYIELHIAVLLYGLTAVLGDLIQLPAVILVWWRVLITTFSLLFFIRFGRDLLTVKRSVAAPIMLIGCIVAIHWICFYGSIKLANASVALVCMATTTIFTSLLEPWIMKKKIDPRLVAAVLDFDNDEQRIEINALKKGNAEQELSLQNQSSILRYSWWTAGLLAVVSLLLIGVNKKRKSKADILHQEKIELERTAKIANQRIAEQALAERQRLERKQEELTKKAEILRLEKANLEKRAQQEKQRLSAQAAAERKRLQEKQEELKNRVADIEQSNQILGYKLESTQNQLKQEYIVINTKTKVHKIKIDQLKYVIAENDGTRFHLIESNFWVIMSLKEIIELLPPEYFVRIFRSTVVNAGFIMAINSTYVVLENGEELTMSRTYREKVKVRFE